MDVKYLDRTKLCIWCAVQYKNIRYNYENWETRLQTINNHNIEWLFLWDTSYKTHSLKKNIWLVMPTYEICLSASGIYTCIRLKAIQFHLNVNKKDTLNWHFKTNENSIHIHSWDLYDLLSWWSVFMWLDTTPMLIRHGKLVHTTWALVMLDVKGDYNQPKQPVKNLVIYLLFWNIS